MTAEDQAICAAVIARPGDTPEQHAAALGIPVPKFLVKRFDSAIDARVVAEINRRTFGAAQTAAAAQLHRSVGMLVALRDGPHSTNKDRMLAAKLLADIALRLDDRQTELDKHTRLSALVAGITAPPALSAGPPAALPEPARVVPAAAVLIPEAVPATL